ncbi:hypothetical protein H4R99_006616 [Coemansia sp. RSA 1722]|nr:hypothetical protein H4R99_006616 [Coemansia sp. RSA 1722]
MLCSFGMTAVALSAKEMDAIESFLETVQADAKSENGTTMEEIVHDLAAGLNLHNSAGLLYKYSPDKKSAYNTIYDTLIYLSVSGFSTPAQKKELAKVIKYFEINLLK